MPSRRHAFWPVPEEPRQLRRPGVSRFPVRQRAAGQVLDSLLQRILTRSWPSAAIAASGSGSRGARGDIEQLARPWTCCRGSLPGAGQRRRSPPADPSATVPGATSISWPAAPIVARGSDYLRRPDRNQAADQALEQMPQTIVARNQPILGQQPSDAIRRHSGGETASVLLLYKRTVMEWLS